MKKKQNIKRFTVIVLDDDATYLKVWGKVLKAIPACTYRLIKEPQEALKAIRSSLPDMVISETVLPSGDGYEIAELTQCLHPDAEVILTSSYDCDLSRFNLKNPRFSILHKPYNDMSDIQKFIKRLLHKENPLVEISEDSVSDNETHPEVKEWKL